jgi:PAS domain S-box-containing protein
MLGFAPEELVGRKFRELLHPDDLDGARTAMQAALNAEEVPIILGRVRTKEGGYKLLEGTAAAGFDRDGRPAFVVTSSRDVTERAQLEEQLRQSQKMEAIGRLAGGIAHDFNNLLLAIRGFGELALRRLARGEDDASADIEDMLDAASRAADLTRQLLALSRRQVMRPELLDLRLVVDQMVKLLRRLIGDNVELSTAWPDDPVLVKADQAQLEQVIANLALNARDAMPDGGHLSIEVIADSVTAERRALLIVSDSGVGMDTETTAQIFEPFFTTKGELGTGLGLATVHGIVTQTGGEIAVESTPGAGTTFTIALPLGEGLPRTKPAAEAASRPGTETILLVEDDPAVRSSVARTLEEYGYGVIPAESGEAAIAICRENATSVDLLLTDLMMRGLNGRETADRIRALQPLARVLFMSGYTDDLVVPVGEFQPRTAFIQKPFKADDLARRIRELLDPRAA